MSILQERIHSTLTPKRDERIKELEQNIQKEIWRIQMIDYPTPNTNDELHKMQKELKELNTKER